MRLVDSTVPAEPSELAAINVTEHSITLSWAVEGAAERVYIEISDTDGGQTQSLWVGVKTRSKTIEGLTPGQGNFKSLQYLEFSHFGRCKSVISEYNEIKVLRIRLENYFC